MIIIHDAMSQLRAKLEVEASRSPFSIRTYLEQVDNSPDLNVFVWDGAKAKSVRQSVYPDYKAQRKPMQPSISEGLKYMRSLLDETRAVQIEIPGFEADDVIAALATWWGKEGAEIQIETRDRDLRALTDRGNVTVTAERYPNVEDKHLRLYKTFVGDPSDNIKGVPGFGAKSWEKSGPVILGNVIDNLSRGVGVSLTELKEFMPPACAAWICNNQQQLLIMYAIVGFLPVPQELVARHTRAGTPSPQARDRKLAEWML